VKGKMMLVRGFYKVTIVYDRENEDDIPADYIEANLSLSNIIIESVESDGWDAIEPLSENEERLKNE